MKFYSYFIAFIVVTFIFSLKDITASEVRSRFVGTAVITMIISLLFNH